MIKKTLRTKVVTRGVVLPEVAHVISEYICPTVRKCANVFIGNEQHQLEVLRQIGDIMDVYNITHGEGYVLRALFQDNTKLAIDIAKAFNNYNLGVEMVRENIGKLPDLTDIPDI